MSNNERVEIIYCAQCRWLPRAAWTAQELLGSLGDEISEVALVQGRGGVFEIRVGGQLVWSLSREGRFPEIKELKRIVRDIVSPGKDMGHIDR